MTIGHLHILSSTNVKRIKL